MLRDVIGVFFLWIIICCYLTIVSANVAIGNNKTSEIQQPIVETKIEEITEVLPPIIDEIELKQKEMRDTTVLVRTRRGNGSGTIIDRLETDTDEIFEYRVLTNAHVTNTRFITYLYGVNSLTGKVKTKIVDTGCEIITFDCKNKGWDRHSVKIVAEDLQLDLAILSFQSSQEFAVAKIANKDILKSVRVFDEVFAIGCQLGHAPTPTVGIISQILIGQDGKLKWVIYANTAQIIRGSSGGGLYKKYDGKYYLIGVPYRIDMTYNGQLIPHLAYAISIAAAIEFIDQNSVSYP